MILSFNRAVILSLLLVSIGLFFLPISIGLSNFLIVAAVVSLFAGQWRQRFSMIFQYRFVWVSLAFVVFIFCAAFWNSWNLHAGIMEWKKYTYKIIVFLLLLPFLCHARWRRRAFWSLVLGAVLISIILSVLRIFHLADSVTIATLFHHKIRLDYSPWSLIPLSILCAYLAYALLLLACQTDLISRVRVYYFVGALWFYIYLFFFNPKRTGMVCALVLLIVLAFQKLRFRRAITILFSLAILVVLLYQFSPMVHKRFDKARANIASYQQAAQSGFTEKGSYQAIISPLGLRFYAVHLGQQLFKHKPLLGYGSGSFSDAYHSLHDKFLIHFERTYFGDPDNAYLYVAVQWGAVGLILFLLWMIVQFYEAKHLTLNHKRLARGLIINFMVACLFSSAFWEHISLFSFLMVSAILYGTRFEWHQAEQGGM